MRVGILGGTGPAGGALATRLASVGVEVVIGSRAKERAAEACDRICRSWPGRDLTLDAGDNDQAARAELVIVATPWDAAAAAARSVGAELDGKTVVCMANGLVKVGREFQPLVPARGSVAASVQAAVPAARVVAALHHLPAHSLADLTTEMAADVLICSDHPDATAAATALVATVPGLRPLDAGPLSGAGALEAMTAVLLHLNVKYKARTAIRILGIDR